MKKIIITFFISLIILLLLYSILSVNEENITVASCPTFYYMLEKLDGVDWIKTVKTESTAESINLYEKREIDIIISGRPLKKSEPALVSEKVGKGYDFLYKEDLPMWEKEMELLTFYTNLSLEEIINDFRYITEDNLIKIEGDIESHIKDSVVITSLDGNLIGATAQIFKPDFSRVRLTRLPRIHYKENINKEKLDIIRNIIKEE